MFGIQDSPPARDQLLTTKNTPDTESGRDAVGVSRTDESVQSSTDTDARALMKSRPTIITRCSRGRSVMKTRKATRKSTEAPSPASGEGASERHEALWYYNRPTLRPAPGSAALRVAACEALDAAFHELQPTLALGARADEGLARIVTTQVEGLLRRGGTTCRWRGWRG